MKVDRLRLPMESISGWVKSSSLSLWGVSGANWVAMIKRRDRGTMRMAGAFPGETLYTCLSLWRSVTPGRQSAKRQMRLCTVLLSWNWSDGFLRHRDLHWVRLDPVHFLPFRRQWLHVVYGRVRDVELSVCASSGDRSAARASCQCSTQTSGIKRRSAAYVSVAVESNDWITHHLP